MRAEREVVDRLAGVEGPTDDELNQEEEMDEDGEAAALVDEELGEDAAGEPAAGNTEEGEMNMTTVVRMEAALTECVAAPAMTEPEREIELRFGADEDGRPRCLVGYVSRPHGRTFFTTLAIFGPRGVEHIRKAASGSCPKAAAAAPAAEAPRRGKRGKTAAAGKKKRGGAEESGAVDGELLSLPEAAEVLGVSRAAVAEMLEDGRLEGHQVGKRTKVAADDVKKLKAEGVE